MSELKVAITTNYWKNSPGGGIRVYLLHLVDALNAHGVDVQVIFRQGEDPQQLRIDKNKLLYSFECFLSLIKIKPDVVHSQETWYCLLPAVLYKQLSGCRVVHTFHSDPGEVSSAVSSWLLQALIDRSDRVTFVSGELRRRVIELYRLRMRRSSIVYAGAANRTIDDDAVERFRMEYNIPGHSQVLLAQGLTAIKLKAQGLRILIDAVALLREKFPGLVLVATREGAYSDRLKEYAHSLGLSDRIIFTGDLEDPYVPLKLCDIYAHISLSDGLPMALLEAMCMGKPIVATPIGGIPEAIRDGWNGYLVQPDPEMIARQIEFLLCHRDDALVLAYNAKRTAEERFTWEQAVEKLLTIYKAPDRYDVP